MKYLMLIIMVLLFSCSRNGDNSSNVNFDNTIVTISDSNLISIIKDYIKETEIDPAKTYLILEIASIRNREIIMITYGTRLSFNYRGFPSYLSFINDHLIFIYSNSVNYIQNNIEPAIMYYADKHHIIFSDQKGVFFFDPPVWKLTRCDAPKFHVDKSPMPLIEDVIPCGYKLDLFTNELDTMIYTEE